MFSPRRPNGQQPTAMVAAPVALPAMGLLSGVVMCTASFVGSARQMQMEMPKFPKMPAMPKMPSLPSLPKFPGLPGQGKTEAEAKKSAPVVRAPPSSSGGRVRVRVASGGVAVPEGAKSAPNYADITGKQSETAIAASSGWKRFPKKRMPGANLDGWKKIAKEIGPGL
jgi:hypothetical protein